MTPVVAAWYVVLRFDNPPASEHEILTDQVVALCKIALQAPGFPAFPPLSCAEKLQDLPRRSAMH